MKTKSLNGISMGEMFLEIQLNPKQAKSNRRGRDWSNMKETSWTFLTYKIRSYLMESSYQHMVI